MNRQKQDRIKFKPRSTFFTILFAVLLLVAAAGTASAMTFATGGSIAPFTIKASSQATGVIGLNLSSDSGDTLTSLNVDFLASGPGFDINDLNPLSNDPTSGVSLYYDSDGDGQFSDLSDEQVPLLFPDSVFAPPMCLLTIDPAYALIHSLPASSDIYNYFVVIRTSSGISNGDIIAASIIAPDSIWASSGPALLLEPIIPAPIIADTVSPELVSAKYISSTELEMTFNESIASVDQSKISLTDDNNDPILLTGDPVLIEDNLVTVITESTGEDTGFSIENTNVGLDLDSGAVLDESGNPNPGYTDEMVSDGQNPELLSARFISSTQIEMNFSEEFDLVFPENISLTNDTGVTIGIYGCDPGYLWNIAILTIESIGDDPSFNISNESQGLDLHYFAVADTAEPQNTNDEVLNIPVGDGIPPSVSAVSIMSSNEEDNTIAITGDDINISFAASEPLFETPGIIIAGHPAAVSHDGLFYNATYTVQPSDADGPATFSIDYADLAGNAGPRKSSTDDESSVMIDQSEPPGLALITPVEGFIHDNNFVSLNFTASDDEDEDVDYRLFINGVENTTGNVTCGGYKTVDLSLNEGEYNWSVTIWDSTGKYNSSDVLNFTVDTEAPELMLVSPEEGTINETGSITFNFTAFDTVDDTLDYALLINGVENKTGTIDSGCFENVTVDLEDGEYNWSVIVSDASEKYHSSSFLNFTVDTEAPELALIAPEEEYINDTGLVTFNFTAFDIVDEDLDYTLFINGVGNTSGTIVCGDFENVSLSLDEGEYNWSVTVRDSSGKLNESCVLNFTVDTTSPELALVAPVDEFINDSGLVTFNFTAFDTVDDTLDYSLFINGIENTNGTIDSGCFETVDLFLLEGDYNWSVTVSDASEKYNSSNVLNLTVDTEAPEITLVVPADEFINDSGSVTFNFTAFDTIDNTLDYTLFINGIENTTGTIDSGCFETLLVDFVEGEYNWSVSVWDASGKYNSSSVLNFTVDTKAPELMLISPEDEFINDSGLVTFNFTAFDTVDDTLDYSLFINGIENKTGTIDSGCFEYVTVGFADGAYNWSVTICDASGKFNSSSVLNFIVDTEAPELILITPEEGAINDTGLVTLNFTAFDSVDDTLDYTLFINGEVNRTGNFASETYVAVPVSFADGKYNWSVAVRDDAFNTNISEVFNFTVDTETPELMIMSPEEGAINDTGSVTFTFSASDNVDELINYTLFINGEVNRTGYLASGTSVNVPISFTDGEYNWSVAVRDDAFNANISEVFNFTVDTEAPELILVAPEEGAINDTGSVTFTFGASDNVDELVNYTLLINEVENSRGTLSSGSFETVSLELADGKFNWSVAVRDDAFNTNISEVFNFTVDTEAPELILMAPEEGVINDTGSVTFTFGASDNVDELINYTLFINGEVNRTGYLASETYVNVPVSFADGEYNWSVSVRDDAFNTNISDALNFVVDTEAPELVLMGPEEGAVNDTGSFTFTFSTSDNVDELVNYILFINGVENSTGTLSSGSFETVSLDFADGEYNWCVSVWDDAINTNVSDAHNFTVDTVAPELTLVAPEDEFINDTGSVTFTFTASDNVDDTLDYTLFVDGEVNRTGNFSSGAYVNVPVSFADGRYNWSLSVWDNAINTGISSVLNFTVDTVAPGTSVDAPEGMQDAPFWANFIATDADPSSGIKSTYYKFEGDEGWTAGDSVYIDVDGVYNISYYSEDFAGNRELAKLVRVELDTSPVLEDLKLVPSTILNNSADISIVTVNVTDPSGTGIMKVTIDLSPIGGASEVEMSSPDGVHYTYGISTDQVGEFSFNVSATNNNEVNPTSTVHLPSLKVIAADDVYSEFGGSDEDLSPSEVGSVVTGTTVSEGVKYAILSAYFNADGWDLL